MAKRTRIPLFFAVVLGAALGLGLVTSTVMAESQPLAALPVTVAMDTSAPQIDGLDDTSVLDAVEYEVVSDITQRLTPYVTVGDDGRPVLADVTAEQLGVDQEFLDNLRLAMEFSYETIDNGTIVVNDDLTVEAGAAGPSETRVIGSMTETDPAMPDELLGGLGDSSIEWQGWNYPQGAMFYNSYPDYWNYYYNRYYMLANSMAAYLGYPWMSSNLVYFYSYNTSYFQRHCLSNYGMYFYLPYHSMCRTYNPCFGSGLSYRPVYIWVRAYVYYQPCSCYRQNWMWQGYWGRY